MPARPTAAGEGGGPDGASKLKERNRAEFKRYKEDVEREGKPFFPYAICHDTIMSLVVVAVIIGLACIWYYTADGDRGRDPRAAGTPTRPTRARRVRAAARLVLLLPLLPPAHLQVAGDGRARHGRRADAPPDPADRPAVLRPAPRAAPLRRPVALVAAVLVVLSMGVLTWKGATAKEALGSETVAARDADEWAEKQGFAGNAEAVAGATLFAESGCLNCHTYLGTGGRNLGAPDLSEVGDVRPRRRLLKSYVSNPAQYGNNGDAPYA